MENARFIHPPAVFKNAVSMEHALAHVIGWQENDGGIWVDTQLAQESILDLDEKITNIESELEPILPLQVEIIDSKVKGENFTEGVKRWKLKNGLSKTVKEWFDPEKRIVKKERGQKRKDGTRAVRTYVYPEVNYNVEDVVEGPFCRVGWFKLELSSSDQVCNFLLSEGWIPTEYNVKKVTPKEAKDPSSPYYKQVPGKTARNDKGEEVYTSPKLTEDSFGTIKGNTGKLIVTRRSYSHRKKFIEGILRATGEDGKVRQGAITHGAISGRMTHRVIVNTPRASSPYGAPCRAIFVAREPYWNFGADLSGLEDRIKAHYCYKFPGGEAYAEKILNPEYDPHTESSELWCVDRETAKPGNYALAYICSPKKLSKTLNVDEATGMRYYNAYWDKNLPLKLFNDTVIDMYKKRKKEDGRGWVVGLDGRVLFPRAPHATGNMLFQSGGNIVAKTAACMMYSWVRKNNIDGWQWSFNHDEYQYCIHNKYIKNKHWFDNKEEATEFWKHKNIPLKSYFFSKPSHIEDKFLVVESPVCHAMITAFIKAGRKYKLRVETTGECMVGKNWAQCH